MCMWAVHTVHLMVDCHHHLNICILHVHGRYHRKTSDLTGKHAGPGVRPGVDGGLSAAQESESFLAALRDIPNHQSS